MADPIEVPASPIPNQVMAALRVGLMAVGTWLTQRGFVSEGDIASLEVILPAAFTVATFVWSQWATRKNAQKAAVAADAAPNNIAVTK